VGALIGTSTGDATSVTNHHPVHTVQVVSQWLQHGSSGGPNKTAHMMDIKNAYNAWNENIIISWKQIL